MSSGPRELPPELAPGIPTSLPEGIAGVARDLALAKRGGDSGAHAEAFAAFRSVGFSGGDWICDAASFLAELYEGEEEVLTGWIQPAELVQELSAGQADLALTAASYWALGKDWPRLIQFADALLAAKSHIRSDDALTIMAALSTTLAFRRHHRAVELLRHVEESQRGGAAPDQGTVEEARMRCELAQVVAAADEAVRDLWDQRLTAGRRIGNWDSGIERQALNELADWLPADGAIRAPFAKVVPVAWWDLYERSEGALREQAERMRKSEEREAAADFADARSPLHQGAARDRRARAEGREVRVRKGAEVPWRWFLAGGMVGVVCWGLVATLMSRVGVPSGGRPLGVLTAVAKSGDRPGEVAVLSEELRHVGNLEMLRAASWRENALLLTGRATELPFNSRLYRDLLILLHWAPSTDAETREKVPQLLLDRSPDGELIALWEKVIREHPEMGEGIRIAAGIALNQVSASWTPEQRRRLEGLRGEE